MLNDWPPYNLRPLQHLHMDTLPVVIKPRIFENRTVIAAALGLNVIGNRSLKDG